MAHRIEILADRFDGRRRVAEAIGLEESFTRGVAASTPTAIDASTAAIVGWPERLTGHFHGFFGCSPTDFRKLLAAND